MSVTHCFYVKDNTLSDQTNNVKILQLIHYLEHIFLSVLLLFYAFAKKITNIVHQKTFLNLIYVEVEHFDLCIHISDSIIITNLYRLWNSWTNGSCILILQSAGYEMIKYFKHQSMFKLPFGDHGQSLGNMAGIMVLM